MQNKYKDLLDELYSKAEIMYNKSSIITSPNNLSPEVAKYISIIVANSESSLAILNVTVTSLVEKTVNPNQDIRRHQAKMEGGYSGRTLDTAIIAPWLKSKKFNSMRESGWLTRSLEQNMPYTLEYRGAIRNKEVKHAFLDLLHEVEQNKIDTHSCLLYLITLLIELREINKVEINPLNSKSAYSINKIIELLSKHFEKSNQAGTARLPVLAIFAVYQSLMDEVNRFKGKTLQP